MSALSVPVSEIAWTATSEAGSSGSAGEAERPDGRRLRRERNRHAVVDALLDLYRDGNLRPSSAQIAERAGLSSRSVFRYFDDVDDLCRAAIQRQLGRALPLVALGAGPSDPLAVRIEALAGQRVRLFGAVGPAALVSRIEAPFQPLLAVELSSTRSFLRAQIAQLFAPELASLDPGTARAILRAADVVCSFESFHLLVTDQGLGEREVHQVMAAALGALLAGAGGAGALVAGERR